MPTRFATRPIDLIDGPGFDRFVQNFTDYWLNLRHIRRDEPDIRLYPEYRFDDYLIESMERETRTFFTAMIRDNLPSSVLVDADFVYVNDRLAQALRIGSRSPVRRLRKVMLPDGSPYGGLLTQAAILKVTANGTSTSPVIRGAWIMERLIGQPPPPPPASVPAVEPDIRGAKTIRELLALHTKSESCAGCHARFDPVGLALENFDVLGGWRTRYRGIEAGRTHHRDRPCRPRLRLRTCRRGRCQRPFAGRPQLSRHPRIESRFSLAILVNWLAIFCISSRSTRLELRCDSADRAEIESILDACAPDGYRVRDLLHALVQSRIFLGKEEVPMMRARSTQSPSVSSQCGSFARAAASGWFTVCLRQRKRRYNHPRRMLLISNNLGVLPKPFFPEATGRDYELSPYLAELAEFRDDFTVISGLSHPDVDGGHSTENCFLTAARGPTKSGFRNTISLDQFAAERLGPVTRFPTLNLGVNIDKANRSLSWTRDGVLLPAEDSAPALFRKMFVQGDPAAVQRQLHHLDERGSILDTLLDDTRQFRRDLGRDDQSRLDQYLTSVREIEERLHTARQWELRPKPTTDQPAPDDIRDQKLFFEKFDLMLSMARLALESDSTRIVTLMVDAFATPVFKLHPDQNTTDGYHNLSHHGQAEDEGAAARRRRSSADGAAPQAVRTTCRNA